MDKQKILSIILMYKKYYIGNDTACSVPHLNTRKPRLASTVTVMEVRMTG